MSTMRIVVREKRTETPLPHTAIRAWIVGARNRRKERAILLARIDETLDRFLASHIGAPLDTSTATPEMLSWLKGGA